MICKNCGMANADSAKICSECGSELRVAKPAEEKAAESAVPESAQPVTGAPVNSAPPAPQPMPAQGWYYPVAPQPLYAPAPYDMHYAQPVPFYAPPVGVAPPQPAPQAPAPQAAAPESEAPPASAPQPAPPAPVAAAAPQSPQPAGGMYYAPPVPAPYMPMPAYAQPIALPAQKDTYHTKAIWAMALGIVSAAIPVITCSFGAPIGIVAGFIAIILGGICMNKVQPRDKSKAIAGLVLGIVGTLFCIVSTVMLARSVTELYGSEDWQSFFEQYNSFVAAVVMNGVRVVAHTVKSVITQLEMLMHFLIAR